MDNDIHKVVNDVLDTGYYINGPNAKAFEKEFAEYHGAKYGISVTSGTNALYMTFYGLNFKPGDEFIAPSHTFIASASQAIKLGLKPVFAEINPDNYTMDIDDVRSKITEKTRVIIAVHIYGHPVDMDPLLELAKEKNIIIVEDCAQSHGSRYKGKLVGNIGDYGCFSFFPSKIMTVGGDGGMIITNNKEMYTKLQMLKNHGRDEKYTHTALGMNMRMPEIPAAIGRVQLKKLNDFVEKRKEIASKYNEEFNKIDQIQTQKIEDWADPAWYAYVIQIDSEEREKFMEYLSSKGIASGIHYPIPVHKQPIIIEMFGDSSLPLTEQLCSRIVTLPLSATLTDEEVDYVIESVKEYFS